MPDAEPLSLHQLYRAMRWLGAPLPKSDQTGATPFGRRTRKDRIEEGSFARRRDLFNQQLPRRPDAELDRGARGGRG